MNIRIQAPLLRRAARKLGRHLLQWGDNNGTESPWKNGERWLIMQLIRDHIATAPGRPFVAFDAGANAGNYTQLILDLAVEAKCEVQIHAFDPAPANVARLRERFSARREVVLVGSAVGEHAASAVLYGGVNGSGLATLVPRSVLGDALADTQSVSVIRLESYLEKTGINHVDLLKLDIEGFEFSALLGLGDRLRPDSVAVIQFEYGGTTKDANVTLEQIYSLLADSGYQVAKLFPSSLEIRDFQIWMEHYTYANYVALSPAHLQPTRDLGWSR